MSIPAFEAVRHHSAIATTIVKLVERLLDPTRMANLVRWQRGTLH
jgi:hypothetical protein